jgi:hypothetical protein
METLPRIVRFLGIDECEGSSCPHCGAEGKYIIRFQCDDGIRRGAMRGCVKLFPVSQIANEEMRLREKLNGYIKAYGETAHLNANDTRALDAIEAFYAGQLEERFALAAVNQAKQANQAKYRKR